MTMITIDPDEMNAAGQVFSSAANELADIGSQLTSSACCPMPPVVASDINGLVGAADKLLDRIGVDLHAVAIDLLKRGLVAALDSLAAATGSSREAVAAQNGISLVALGVAAPVVAAASTPASGSTATPTAGSFAAAMGVSPTHANGTTKNFGDMQLERANNDAMTRNLTRTMGYNEAKSMANMWGYKAPERYDWNMTHRS